MEKYFKLNKVVYHSQDYIKVSVKYKKEAGGYILKCELVSKLGDNLYGKCYCPEYYKHDGDWEKLIVPCGRRGNKKETEANEMATMIANKEANIFIGCLCLLLEITDLHIVSEVR